MILHRDPEKSAKNVIRDISGVGTDLRVRMRAVPAPTLPAPVLVPPKAVPAQPPAREGVFMKPAGVDLPKTKGDVIMGARAKSKSSAKRQREADADTGPADTIESQKEGKKKKKKKVSVAAADS